MTEGVAFTNEEKGGRGRRGEVVREVVKGQRKAREKRE